MEPTTIWGILWAIITLVLVPAGMWFGREIIKPFSQARLKLADAESRRADAFTDFVLNTAKLQETLVSEASKQTVEQASHGKMLVAIANSNSRQLTTLNQMNDSSKALCKAGEQHCQASQVAATLGAKLDAVVSGVDLLGIHAKAAADKIENKAAVEKVKIEDAAADARKVVKAAAEEACNTCANFVPKDRALLEEVAAKEARHAKKNAEHIRVMNEEIEKLKAENKSP